MGPEQGICEWVRLHAQQVIDALRGGAWPLPRESDTGRRAALPPGGQSRLVLTRRTLDFAIGGPGYFIVRTPDGLAGTRNGRLDLAPDGSLLAADGCPLELEWRVPAAATHLAVLRTGETVARLKDGRYQALGVFTLGLPAAGGWQRGEPGQNGLGQLLQGALEVQGDDADPGRSLGVHEGHRFRKPAPGSASVGMRRKAQQETRVISSQQVAALVRRMQTGQPAPRKSEPDATSLIEELVRMAVNRLDPRQASELKRRLARGEPALK